MLQGGVHFNLQTRYELFSIMYLSFVNRQVKMGHVEWCQQSSVY